MGIIETSVRLLKVETMKQALDKLVEVQEKLDYLTAAQIEFINSQPINKHQYVKL